MNVDPVFFFVTILVLIFAISIHEFAHAKMADAAGDPTPRLQGRVTLNPLAHLDPMGTMMMVFTTLTGFGIGWGRPVQVNPTKMRNPRWDHFASVAAGPASNLLQAVVYAIALRLVNQMDGVREGAAMHAASGGLPVVYLLLVMGVLINVSLCLFNLIPLGPLDGHWLVGAFMPEPMRIRWYMWNRQVGGFLFIGLVLIGQFNRELNFLRLVLFPMTERIFSFLVGIP
ncbi:MAG: site-2 protease family protein [Armatimonadetes bacterium]|nr:site-2 protease family protein [Armatimonadota bacterium]